MREIICFHKIDVFTIEECVNDELFCLEIDEDIKSKYDKWVELTNFLHQTLGNLYAEQGSKQKEFEERHAQHHQVMSAIEAKKEEMQKIQQEVQEFFESPSALKA